MPNLLCLQGLIRNCSDLDGLKNWYVEQLGLTLAWEQRCTAAWISELFPGTVAASLDCCALRLGQETLWLMSWPEVLMQPMPAATRGIDHWFQHICLVSDALERAYAERLQGACRPISTAPQTLPEWNRGAAGIQAVKFFDLEGHPLELLQFPPGKGANAPPFPPPAFVPPGVHMPPPFIPSGMPPPMMPPPGQMAPPMMPRAPRATQAAGPKNASQLFSI